MQIKPQAVTDLELNFHADTKKLMPAYREIPDEFKSSRNPFVDLVETWFFNGLNRGSIKPKDGTDTTLAIRHMTAIMRSYEPQHEHKIAGVAYLMSQWFDLVEEKAKAKNK